MISGRYTYHVVGIHNRAPSLKGFTLDGENAVAIYVCRAHDTPLKEQPQRTTRCGIVLLEWIATSSRRDCPGSLFYC
jgi:hypothetical protein